jgi:CRISPR-associated protein Csx17
MPIWSRPASFPELRTLFSDGRITLGRHVARDGLDAARAIAQYGAERGIEAFQRYGFLMRSGRAYLATPLSRIRVRRNTSVDLLDQLDGHGWLRSLRGIARSDEAPARLKSAIRRLEDAMFEVAESGEAPALQRTLMALGEICAYLRNSRKTRDASPYPPILRREWSGDAVNDGSAEFHIARSLAAIHALDPSRGDMIVMPMLAHFIPRAGDDERRWAAGDDHDVVWSSGSLESNLASVAQRRLLMSEMLGLADKPFISRTSASLSDIAAMLSGHADMDRVAQLLAGLVLVTPTARHRGAGPKKEPAAIPGAYFVLKPLFCTNQQLIEAKILPKDRQLPLTLSVVLNLAQRRPDRALDEAYSRCRIAGLRALPRVSATGLDGPLLLSTLLVPVDMEELKRMYGSLSSRLTVAPTTI